MLYFTCDYTEGAHPRILQRMAETNLEQTPGYGLDAHCERARALIRAACGTPEADVHFLVGGTQTNLTVIASILRPHQGVVSAATGHIGVHETGAIEASGHKVLPLPTADGKISAAQIDACFRTHFADPTHEHMVQPGMVYLSFPTETGLIYSRAELTAIADVCRQYGTPLFLDGARLGYGLASPENDLTLPDIARLCDVFYIGGTKVGALFGEAVVITNPALGRDFRYLIKQRGGMLAKGRLLGIQFETLFEDGLYDEISRHAVDCAMRIRHALERRGIPMQPVSPTNQQFPVLTQAQFESLSRQFVLDVWGAEDGSHSCRICTSWATRDEAVDALVAAIAALPD